MREDVAQPLDFAPNSRRTFLWAGMSLAAASVWASRARGVLQANPKFASYPFSLGVASGDPAPDGFVLWTRLAPDPLNGGGMTADPVEVSWQVAEDEQMTRIVQKGKAIASPDWAHSVHVEVAGLKPDRWYWYQFKAGLETSPLGRTRTTPLADSTPKSLRFAFASCQHYETGLYTAYEHMAAEELDLVVHLGDYIYEAAAQDKRVRKHVGPVLTTLSHYRNRHAQYKTDAALQQTHARFPWIVTWDDHEFANNCAGAISQNPRDTTEQYLARRAQAYKAYYEHMPLRRAQLPTGPDMPLYRRIRYGKLAEFSVCDTRQYRSDQPCGDGKKPQCAEALSPERSLLGAEQEKWLLAGLEKSAANWNVLAQQVMMARVDRESGEKVAYSMDQWPGYEANRRRILKFFAERRVANPVVLGGDIHTNWVNDLIADFDNFDSAVVGTEFVGTSLSSSGNGSPATAQAAVLRAENPFVKFHNAQRGYVSCQVTPQEWRSDYRVVDYVDRPGAPRITCASYVVESGKPGAETA